jgi:hypothetical protein
MPPRQKAVTTPREKPQASKTALTLPYISGELAQSKRVMKPKSRVELVVTVEEGEAGIVGDDSISASW